MQSPSASLMFETGVVVALKGRMAQVRTLQQDACTGCSAKGACHSMGGGKERQVMALNEAQASTGDQVVLAIPRQGVVGASFLVYLMPVLALIAGALLGQRLGPGWGLGPEGGAIIGAGVLFAAAWLTLRFIDRAMGRKSAFQVRVLKVLREGEDHELDQRADSL